MQRNSLLVCTLWVFGMLCCAFGLPRAQSQTRQQLITITPAQIPLTEAELVNPMRGYYRWYGSEVVAQPAPARDQYARFGWRRLEPTRGQYDFSEIEQALQAAQRTGARFSFRIMSVNEFTSPIEVPSYLVDEAGGSWCSYNGSQLWVPRWDSPQFLSRAEALMNALSTHFNGDVRLGYYDIGLYGHWGEWTNDLCTPSASPATKHALVDIQVKAFSASRMLMNSGGKELDAFVYALSKSPSIGIRVDSLCNAWFDNQFTELPEKLALMQQRWKTAPIITEFYSWNPTDLALCQQQIQAWHIAGLANGGLSWENYASQQQQQLIDLGKHAGYRFVLHSLSFPAQNPNNAMLSISSQWLNLGVTPAYEHFEVSYELRPKGQTNMVWSGVSKLNLEQLLPSSTPQTILDQLYVPGRLPPGSYTLSMFVRDPLRYRAPLLLAITGVDHNGRYALGEITITQGLPGYDVFLPAILQTNQ